MSKIISIHSFRGGTGKSNTTANLSIALASRGLRVGVIDTDIASPGIHNLFNFENVTPRYFLNDFLLGKCAIDACAYDMTGQLGVAIAGRVFLVPSSVEPNAISKMLQDGYDVSKLSDGFLDLVDDLHLDVLLIDTHPGVNEETLLSMATSDALIVVLRPDKQDYQGTSVTVDLARRLNVPNLLMVVNKTPSLFDFADVKARVEVTYDAEVIGVLPHSDEMMTLASQGIFVLHYPDTTLSQTIQEMTTRLLTI